MPSNRIPAASIDFSVRYEYWRLFDSLTLGDIAWMQHGIEPRLEDELPDWADSDLSHELQVLVAAAHAGTIEATDPIARSGPVASTRVKRNSRLFDWLRDKGWDTVADGLDEQRPKQSHSKTLAAVSRQTAQETAILNELRRLGHDPAALPSAAPGKPGVKALVRKALSGSTGLFAGTTVFDKAWDRLRTHGTIN